MLAELLHDRFGFRTTVCYALATDGSVDPNRLDSIDGLEALDDADLLVLFTRFRRLPDEQLAHITGYVESGRPVVGFRTATHAFRYPEGDPHAAEMNEAWPTRVFGQHWITHHGHFDDGERPLTSVTVAAGAEESPILRGVEPFAAFSWLYHVDGGTDALSGDCLPLLRGTALRSSHVGEEARYPPVQPVAWTKTYTGTSGKPARVFFSTLGHPYDFEIPAMRRLAVQGILWALGREADIPAQGVDVAGVAYAPRPSGFGNVHDPWLWPRAPRRGSAKAFALQKGERIALVGNTFADRMRYHGWFEAMLQAARPDLELVVRNLGWSGDAVTRFPIVPSDELHGGPAFRYWKGDRENTSTRPDGYPDQVSWLHEVGATTVMLCYGMGESFAGAAGLPAFRDDLRAEIRNVRRHSFDGGKSHPQIVVVSPIAHENVGGLFPDPTAHDADLARYVAAMAEVAAAEDVYFVDLFTPTRAAVDPHRTINGIHLTDAGYREIGALMLAALGIASPPPQRAANLRPLVDEKARLFMQRYRPSNAEYVWGTREQPFGSVDFPARFTRLDQLIAAQDDAIHEAAR